MNPGRNDLDNSFDELLSLTLKEYIHEQPRPGLDRRILANLPPQRTSMRWPLWASLATALVLVIVTILHRPASVRVPHDHGVPSDVTVGALPPPTLPPHSKSPAPPPAIPLRQTRPAFTELEASTQTPTANGEVKIDPIHIDPIVIPPLSSTEAAAEPIPPIPIDPIHIDPIQISSLETGHPDSNQ
jgi:hypothetical protein